MADVLGLLREYHLNNKEIIENKDEIIFGEFAWPKTAKTNYLMWGTGKEGTPKDYYTLDCIVYLLKNIDLQHSQYVRQAAAARVPVVRLPDRKELLAYLKGETNTASNIDRTVPVDISIRRAVTKTPSDLQGLRRGDHLDMDSQLDAKRKRMSYEPEGIKLSSFDQTDLKGGDIDQLASREDADKGIALSKAIPLDKIRSLRERFRRNQQQVPKSDGLGGVSPGEETRALGSPTRVPFLNSAASDRLHGLASREDSAAAAGPNSQTIVMIDEQMAPRPLGSGAASDFSVVGVDSKARGALLASDVEIVRVISSRERCWRTRPTILQSQGKTFYENIVLGILRNVMLKENAHLAPEHRPSLRDATSATLAAMGAGISGYKTPVRTGGLAQSTQQQQPMQYSRYEQERFATGREELDGFRINTMATYHGKALSSMVMAGGPGVAEPPATPLRMPAEPTTATPSAYSNYGMLTPKDPRSTPIAGMTPDPYRSGVRSVADARGNPHMKPRASRVPIIIIPAAPTSLISMLNATDILQELRFVSPEEKHKQGYKRETELLIHRQKSDGSTVPYRVIDQPIRLKPEEWNRVVAVFVQGQAWQFKGWPIGADPAVIFSLLKGFHLKYANMPLDANVAKWNVHVINLDRRRHLDKVNFQTVWDQLDKHIAKYKSFLRS